MKKTIILVLLIVTFNSIFAGSVGNQYFDDNLRKMDTNSRIMLLQCLGGFPKIKKSDFMKVPGLLTYDSYSSNLKKAEKEKKPIRPVTYNEVSINIVANALSNGVLDSTLINDINIKKALFDNRYHKITSWAHKYKIEKFDYKEIVEWAAKENNIPEITIANYSTTQLEEEITVKFFGRIWDGLTEEAKSSLLLKLAEKNQLNLPQPIIASLAATGSASVVLATVASSAGFATYLGAVSLIHSFGSLIGVTIPFAIYQGTTTMLKPFIAALGPVGWTLVGLSLVAEGVYLGFTGKANVDAISAFIMTFHQLSFAVQ